MMHLHYGYQTCARIACMDVRLVFMGSPDFAVPSLKALSRAYNIVGVVTQPDRPSGRGRRLTPPAVKIAAMELGLPLFQPSTLRHPGAIEHLRRWNPQLIVVAAFGQILRKEVLDLPDYGCVNVHASLLPRWRGAAPVQAAILHGDEQSGVTIMLMDEGVDTGPILSQRAILISPEDTGGSLSEKLAQLGADLLIETLPAYLCGEINPMPQDESKVTLAPLLRKQDGALNFQESAEALERKVRAFHPWPGTYLETTKGKLKVHHARALTPSPIPGTMGTFCVYERFPAVICKDGLLVLEVVQPPGKNPMPGNAYLAGARIW